MDLLSVTRTLGGLGIVLGLLWAALWIVRRYDIQLPGRTGTARRSRLELVERLAIDARRSVALVRRDGREHLILIAPEGHVLIEADCLPPTDKKCVAAADSDCLTSSPVAPANPVWSALPAQDFGALVEKVRLHGRPAVPHVAAKQGEPVYRPARKQPVRRRKSAGAVVNA